jgi:hypothetical protein
MLILLLFAILFMGGCGYNVYMGDYYNALADAGISAFIIGIYVFYSMQKKKNLDFLRWIGDNKERINSSGVDYKNGLVIDRYTELAQYYACISLLVITIKFPSRYYVKGTFSANMAMIIYTLTTFLLGWWGLPKGPIYTLQIIFKNVRGSYNTEIYKLFGQD